MSRSDILLDNFEQPCRLRLALGNDGHIFSSWTQGVNGISRLGRNTNQATIKQEISRQLIHNRKTPAL